MKQKTKDLSKPQMPQLGSREGGPSKRTQEMIRKLEEKKYEDNHLKELERRRFLEAKLRLKNFVINREPSKELDEGG